MVTFSQAWCLSQQSRNQELVCDSISKMQSIRASCSRNFLTVRVGDKGIPDGLDLNERDPNLWFDKTISRARTKKTTILRYVVYSEVLL